MNQDDLKRMEHEVRNYFNDSFNVANPIGYFPGFKSFEDHTPQDYDMCRNSNAWAPFYVLHSLENLWKERGGGHFIAYSCNSTKTDVPLDYLPMISFTRSKELLNELILENASEYRRYDILLNAFLCTTIDTPFERKIKPNGDWDKWLKPLQIAKETYVLSQSETMMGNLIKISNHSDTYKYQTFAQRNDPNHNPDGKLTPEQIQEAEDIRKDNYEKNRRWLESLGQYCQ